MKDGYKYNFLVISQLLTFARSNVKNINVKDVFVLIREICNSLFKNRNLEIIDLQIMVGNLKTTLNKEDLIRCTFVHSIFLSKARDLNIIQVSKFATYIDYLCVFYLKEVEVKGNLIISYDFIDAIHAFPDAILNPIYNEESFIQTYIEQFESKWKYKLNRP
jgi:hypothetical protein